MENTVYIGLLLGAGPNVSSKTQKALRQLLYETFNNAQSLLNDQQEPLSESDLLNLTSTITAQLEDSEHTNTGKGSELTLNGSVECDASLMLSGKIQVFGSVGAVPGLPNPIYLCRELIKLQLENTKRNRGVPNFLVGDGAYRYALNLGLKSTNLVTTRAQQSYTKWKQLIHNQPDSIIECNDKYMDTVGVIVIYNGTHCVASSSGGSLLKDPGRVGPAALISSGLDTFGNTSAVCSGFGEDINSVKLASWACSKWSEDSVDKINIMRLQCKPAQFGILRATAHESGVVFEWKHTTPTMICGFGVLKSNCKPKLSVIISTSPQQGGENM